MFTTREPATNVTRKRKSTTAIGIGASLLTFALAFGWNQEGNGPGRGAHHPEQGHQTPERLAAVLAEVGQGQDHDRRADDTEDHGEDARLVRVRVDVPVALNVLLLLLWPSPSPMVVRVPN